MAFTVAELAERWNCSTKTIWRLIKAGKIRAFKVGREWRVTATCVHNYEAQQQSR